MTAPQDVNILVGSLATGFGRLFPFGVGVEPGTVNTTSTWPCVLYNVAWGWYWLEGIAGWFLAGIGVAGLTNLVRRV
jgi:hypothetical protein